MTSPVLSLAAGNLTAAFLPGRGMLGSSAAEADQRAVVMVVLGFPIMVIFALLATKSFGRPVAADEPG